MDLGIAGRNAIVCASSRGLGRACATALAHAGARVAINGRDPERLARTRDEIAAETGAEIVAVAGDMSTEAGRAALLAAFPQVDILVNNNGGPPPRDFRQVDRDAMIAGLEANMIAPVALIQAVIDGMIERRFGRIVNITSGSVKMPMAGLDLSSGARAGLTGFVGGVARSVAHANVTINNLLPGAFDTDRIAALIGQSGAPERPRRRRDPPPARAGHSGETVRRSRRVRRRLRLPLLGPGRLHHRPEHPDRRRRLSGHIMIVAEPVRPGRVFHGTGDGVDSLVSTEWLERELGAPDLKLIDATAFLPGTGRDARAEFEQEHIPGAVHVDLEEVSDSDSPFPHMLPSEAKFSSRMQSLGRARRQPLRRLRQQPDPHLGADLVDAEELRRPLCRPARRRPAEMEGGRAPGLASGREPHRHGHFTASLDPGAAVDKAFVRGLVGAGTHELVDARPAVALRRRRPGTAAGPRLGPHSGRAQPAAGRNCSTPTTAGSAATRCAPSSTRPESTSPSRW